MNKAKLMPTIVLGSICIVVALLLSTINLVTAPIIKAAADKKANETLVVVLPEGEDFEEIDLSTVALPPSVTKAFKETGGKGYVFEVTSAGYKSGLVIMCGIDAEGKITGSKYTASGETYGAEIKLDGMYNGQTPDTFAPQAVSGATKTSGGYRDAIKAALDAFVVMSGGTVDFRDENTIIQDNCNLALGTEGMTFEKWFALEELGVDALYISGRIQVALVDGYYVGIDLDGTVLTNGVNAETGVLEPISDEIYVTVENAYVIYSGVTLTEVALPEGVNKNVLSAYRTTSGNYMFELQAAGYGIEGDWNTSGEYIKLKVVISPDGKIISTLTTYQNESEGIGDICADPSYYESFNGREASTYKDVENVTGATVTTRGYKRAIGYAFDAFEKITGGTGNE